MSKREDLIEALLEDLGVDATEQNFDMIETFLAMETNLREWPDDLGAQTWADQLRSARNEADRCRLALEVALRDLEQLRAAK